MPATLNTAMIMGNLGRDPEVRQTQNGTRMANLSIATSKKYKDRQGNQQEDTQWHRVVIFGPLVDVVEKYTRKGSNIFIQGELRTRKWQDQAGNDRFTTEIVVSGPQDRILLNDSRSASQQQEASGPDVDEPETDMLDEEIPF